MSAMKRLVLAILIVFAVTSAGAVLFQELEIGGLAWYGLLIVAMVTGSLFDREHFYGPRQPSS